MTNTSDIGAGITTLVERKSGAHFVLEFDPAVDRLNFGSLQPSDFEVTEAQGGVVVSITGADETYTLKGVTLAELSSDNILAADAGTLETWQALLDAAQGETETASISAARLVATADPQISIADARLAEGNAGTTDMVFKVTLSAAADHDVTVRYATRDGVATAGTDYQAQSGTLTFAAGQTTAYVHVPVIGDQVVEPNESFALRLVKPIGATLADNTAIGTIVNDDAATAPKISIADARLAEGNAGTTDMVFKVTLSAAADHDVTVRYATRDGVATAGTDYQAQSGTLTFAAGQTTAYVHVPVIGDQAVEPNESFALRLVKPIGATLADNTAIGTIVNDDKASTPTLSVSNTTVVEGNGDSGAAADGWFSTSGNQIIDANGDAVKIAGVNWFGFESSNNAPHGLWTRNYQDMMDQMKELGFNTIRLPFSSDMLHATTASGIDYSQNPDLQGLTPLQIMDKIVAYADEIGMKVILDHHRSSAGSGTSDNGLWYDSTHTEAQWIADWQMLAERYADNSAVIGADLHNEPYAGTWGGGGATDWAAAAERAGNAIGDVNSNWLIFVEGVGTYQGESYWWGGNLMGVRDRPIELEVDNKLVYSAHDYGNSVYAQPWFQGTNFGADLPAKFDEMWGYIYRENIAPVYVGEFGTRLQDPKDVVWLDALTAYMSGDFDNNGTVDIPSGTEGINWTYWSWNPNSGDTGGILADDWRTVLTDKLAYLEPIEFDLGGDVAATANEAAFVVRLSQAAKDTVSVDYHTVTGSADASDFTAVSGTLTFAPGETTKVIHVPVTGDTTAEANEQFSLVLTDASGAVIGTARGIATITDDDSTATALPKLAIADGSAHEGDAGASGVLDFTVSLSAASDTAVSVAYHTADGTAVGGSDYTALSGTLTFAPGTTTATLSVPLIGDSTVESAETFKMVLTDPTGASLADAEATGTITNDDTAPNSGTEVSFAVSDDWGSGFVGTMTLTPEASLNGWTVAFDAPFDIANIWNAEIVSHVGDHYVVRNTDWNGTVNAHGSVSFGFQASPGGTSATASDFAVNGTAVEASASLAAASLLSDDVLLSAVLSKVDVGTDSFQAEVTLHNDGAATDSWSLEIHTPYEITSLTDAQILSHTSQGYVIGNAAGNGTIPAHDEVSFTLAAQGHFSVGQFDLLI